MTSGDLDALADQLPKRPCDGTCGRTLPEQLQRAVELTDDDLQSLHRVVTNFNAQRRDSSIFRGQLIWMTRVACRNIALQLRLVEQVANKIEAEELAGELGVEDTIHAGES
jgi:hypothetical protein